jgi:hypothetical protein
VTIPDEEYSGRLDVRASSATCTWTAASSASWITIASGASGTGDGTVQYEVSENNGLTERTTTLTIAGQSVPVSQAGKLLNLDLSGRISDLTGVCPFKTFTLDQQVIRTTLTTVFTGGTCAQLERNMKVDVTGVKQLDGSMLAVLVALERD